MTTGLFTTILGKVSRFFFPEKPEKSTKIRQLVKPKKGLSRSFYLSTEPHPSPIESSWTPVRLGRCFLLDRESANGVFSVLKDGDTGEILSIRPTPVKEDPAVTETALRYNAGKPKINQIPMDFLAELGEVYEMGAKKYARDNWKKGMDWSICADAAYRHFLLAFWYQRVQKDEESGLHHLAHAVWNLIALWYYEKHGLGNDDRPVKCAAPLAEARAKQNNSVEDIRRATLEEIKDLVHPKTVVVANPTKTQSYNEVKEYDPDFLNKYLGRISDSGT